jgi:outer membrane protein OmpA-like peptidoglycan-associated protein
MAHPDSPEPSTMRRRALLAASPLALLGACAAPSAGPQPLHVVFFEDDSLEPPPAALATIQDAARAAAARPGVPVRVLGYVAPDNTAQAPLLVLSRRRADRVAAELRGFGVAAERIRVLGRGAVDPIGNPVESRRVEIHIGAG